MPGNLFLLLNHDLTEDQRSDAIASLGVNRFIPLPENLAGIWNNVPPRPIGISDMLDPIREWFLREGTPGDFVLIQGDFGAAYLMVCFAIGNGFVPVYATTRRDAVETTGPGGEIVTTRRFNHCRFRRYGE
jgi:hypothetical protein